MWCVRNDNGLSSAYKTLFINTARNLTNVSDCEFPTGTQLFPDHRDMHAYYERFIEQFKLRPLIKFKTLVTAVRPAEQSTVYKARWAVETADKRSKAFDVVVQHIAYRRVEVKHDIETVAGKTIRFPDGAEGEFDTLIAATAPEWAPRTRCTRPAWRFEGASRRPLVSRQRRKDQKFCP
jgi:flavin-binding monooxygenase-like protein